jgi:hypothetical protein
MSTQAPTTPTLIDFRLYICPYTVITDYTTILKTLQALQNLFPNRLPVIIGSRAMRIHMPKCRQPVDWDVVCTSDSALTWLQHIQKPQDISLTTFTLINTFDYKLKVRYEDENYEFEIVVNDVQSGYDILMESNVGCIFLETGHPVKVATLDMLEAIKTSHIYRSHYFIKHITDLHAIRDRLSKVAEEPFKRDDVYEIFMLKRRRQTNEKHGIPGGKVNLNMTNDEFLEGEHNLLVEKMIKHDDIHKLVMMNDVPMYTLIKINDESAMCSQDLWNKLTQNQRLDNIREEAMTLAMERYLLPGFIKIGQDAYTLALTRICTNITKGWYRQFAVDHYPQVSICPKHLQSLATSVVANYKLRLEAEYTANLNLPDEDARLKAFGASRLLDLVTRFVKLPPRVKPVRKSEYYEYCGDNETTTDYIITGKDDSLNISLTTEYQFSGAECSESYVWHGKITITQNSDQKSESTWTKTKFGQLQIECSVSAGGSDYSPKQVRIEYETNNQVFEEYTGFDVVRAFILKYNPTMAPGGERILSVSIADNTDTINACLDKDITLPQPLWILAAYVGKVYEYKTITQDHTDFKEFGKYNSEDLHNGESHSDDDY